MLAAVKFRWSKPLRGALTLPHQQALERIGRRAFILVRDRIQTSQRAADGMPLPKLPATGFRASNADPRFVPATTRDEKAGIFPSSARGATGPPSGTFYAGGYAAAKRRAGARGFRDLTLTGSLWRSPRVNFKLMMKDGLKLTVGFRGRDVKGTRNHDKAWYVQLVGRDGKKVTSPSFYLFQWSPVEETFLFDQLMKATRLWGTPLA